METIKRNVECPACGGTGIYSGIAEGEGVGVVCYKCYGTGMFEYEYKYTPFTGRKHKSGIKRVYKSGSRFKLGLGKIDFDGAGVIDMDKEGISYDEFLIHKLPEYIKRLDCPMSANQGACHKVSGFVNCCNELNGGWINLISSCKMQPKKADCWKRFDNGVAK